MSFLDKVGRGFLLLFRPLITPCEKPPPQNPIEKTVPVPVAPACVCEGPAGYLSYQSLGYQRDAKGAWGHRYRCEACGKEVFCRDRPHPFSV